MKAYILLSVLTIVLVSCSSAQKRNVVPPGELDLQSMIQPVPSTAKFINDTSFIWCGTLVRSHIDKKYHLVALLCAVNETLAHSYNVQIPL